MVFITANENQNSQLFLDPAIFFSFLMFYSHFLSTCSLSWNWLLIASWGYICYVGIKKLITYKMFCRRLLSRETLRFHLPAAAYSIKENESLRNPDILVFLIFMVSRKMGTNHFFKKFLKFEDKLWFVIDCLILWPMLFF